MPFRFVFAAFLVLVTASAAAAAEVPRREEALVVSRVENRVPAELGGYFDTILYVSKAASGPLAQHMYVLRRRGDGTLEAVEKFAVSTGRERKERYFTSTPTGIFQLDRGRMFRMHRSRRWDDAPMPFTIFLDVQYQTRATGVALHAAYGKAGQRALGKRASGGCIRLPPAKARALFEDIQSGRYDADVPVFAYNPASGTSKSGEMRRDQFGEPVLHRGLSILLVVETFAGRRAVAERDMRESGAGQL